MVEVTEWNEEECSPYEMERVLDLRRCSWCTKWEEVMMPRYTVTRTSSKERFMCEKCWWDNIQKYPLVDWGDGFGL